MATRAAIAVATEAFFEIGPPLQRATTDARDLLQVLQQKGYHPCLLWTAHHTTLGALQSHLRRLPESLGRIDLLLVLWITRTWIYHNKTYLACADTLREDPLHTSLPWSQLIELVRQASPSQVFWLCDFDPLEVTPNVGQPGWSYEELAQTANKDWMILTAAANHEHSHSSATLQRGLWRYHLLQAFQGQAAEALNEAGQLTAPSLYRYLSQAVRHTLRKTHENAQQTPLCFPPLPDDHTAFSTSVLAEFAPRMSQPFAWLDPQHVQRVLLRSQRNGRVKELSGFRKSHNVPQRVNEWARRFVQRIGAADLKADLDEMYQRIHEQFVYKRKDLDTSTDATGYGLIRTPDFEYFVLLELHATDPSQVVWRREVGGFSSLEVIRQPAFHKVFGDRIDELVFEFLQPVDVPAYVDRFESDCQPGAHIRLNSDGSVAEITLQGFTGCLCVTASMATISGRLGDPTTLLEQFLTFLPRYWKQRHDTDDR